LECAGLDALAQRIGSERIGGGEYGDWTRGCCNVREGLKNAITDIECDDCKEWYHGICLVKIFKFERAEVLSLIPEGGGKDNDNAHWTFWNEESYGFPV